jgi:hypothetical protein
MSSNYQVIRKEKKRKHGEEPEHLLKLLELLYPDKTHFILELLQNAEDVGATKVVFELSRDRLIVKHDAERVFDEDDVRGICGVGEGTKSGDLNKIGTFGIGFKSVYAYTKSPEIHSGDEHFKIENYIHPIETDPLEPKPPWTTLFILKFNNKEKRPIDAYNEIAGRLKNLKAKTLLFLRSVNEVEYKIENDQSGLYLREKQSENDSVRRVEIIGHNNGIEEDERWLVFEKPIDTTDPNKSVFIEIGFRLIVNKKTETETVQPLSQSPLIVFFPTEKETNLGFLIQGPYKTTPARDNIPKDDDWNAGLISDTTIFLIEVLHDLKKMNLLNVDLLNALPIDSSSFPEDSMFFPIYSEVLNALLNDELLPTNDEGYVSGKNAKLARGSDLRTLLSQNNLEQLYNEKDLNWLDGSITFNRTRLLHKYLLGELSIEEVNRNVFARNLSEEFLRKQSDQWMISFYEFYSDKKDKTSYSTPGPLRNKPIIRLEDDSHVKPFKEDGTPNAYLITTFFTESRLPSVKSELMKSETAVQFLKELGIPELDLVEEVIVNILTKYSSDPNGVSYSEHKGDIQAIIRAYETDSREKKRRLGNALKNSKFLKPKTLSNEKETFKRANELYFNTESLNLYFFNNESFLPISDDYSDKAIKVFKEIGLIFKIPVKTVSGPNLSSDILLEKRSWGSEKHQKGLNGFDPDIEITGLKEALKNPTVDLSKVIWNEICVNYSQCIMGELLKSSRKEFVHHKTTKEKKVSENFGKLLIENDWLPDKSGNLHKPNDLYLEDLPESFARDERLAKRLGMKSNATAKLAEEVGIETEDIDFLRRYPEDFRNWKTRLREKIKPEFPKKASSNPERRKDKLVEQFVISPNKKYQKKERSVKVSNNSTSSKVSLRNLYTNQHDQLICQICKDEMPFKGRDSQDYFESVEAFSKDYSGKEHDAQHLALCPLCAAKYKEFIKKDDDSLVKLRKLILKSSELELPITLGKEDATIRFVETHLMDLKSIIQLSE